MNATENKKLSINREKGYIDGNVLKFLNYLIVNPSYLCAKPKKNLFIQLNYSVAICNTRIKHQMRFFKLDTQSPIKW